VRRAKMTIREAWDERERLIVEAKRLIAEVEKLYKEADEVAVGSLVRRRVSNAIQDNHVRNKMSRLNAEIEQKAIEGNLLFLDTVMQNLGDVEVEWTRRGYIVDGVKYEKASRTT
jgi:hypothetical protein